MRSTISIWIPSFSCLIRSHSRSPSIRSAAEITHGAGADGALVALAVKKNLKGQEIDAERAEIVDAAIA